MWLYGFFTGHWAVLQLPFIAAVVIIFYEILNHRKFNKHMEEIEYPSLNSVKFHVPATWLARAKADRVIGGIWFARSLHWGALWVAGIILVCSFYRAYITGHSLEFSRSGAFLVIVGLISILVGFREVRNIRTAIDVSNANSADTVSLEQHISKPIEEAQIVAAKLSVGISILGTIIWAYGDQLLACGVFPLLDISDASRVNCF